MSLFLSKVSQIFFPFKFVNCERPVYSYQNDHQSNTTCSLNLYDTYDLQYVSCTHCTVPKEKGKGAPNTAMATKENPILMVNNPLNPVHTHMRTYVLSKYFFQKALKSPNAANTRTYVRT